VSGGGRYDNLTQAFGAKEKLSGVGISFGIDRLYDVLEELKLFPKEAMVSSKVLVTHLDEAAMTYGLGLAQKIRNQGISCEIYPELTKIKKQLEYADRKHIPFAIVIGSEEVSSGVLTQKNLATGEQEKLKIEEIVSKLK
jgi:histidyl-tRNA synthetase